ncbi:hypothetical protein DIS18_00245 [Algibacter marinivivus]|uniref:Gliding motility-associated C-terminal domain-containing protein n=1 Tax=Algibacter marinivivus TaxID=2100723 RepID=A0A2U2X5J4_9FLAO|nr:T9SS type B sorting domain-containing protein [Algibacter marinivivus]PWH83022.1 hypothetical protein DIS18_00245 [Algibacter marinivivus]
MKFYLRLSIVSFFLLFTSHILSQSPNDCGNAIITCGNSDINLNVNGGGALEEVFETSDCGSSENNSVWLQVTLVTSGTLGFTLTPNSTAITEDYDFFVYGPNVTCGNIGRAIRCSTTHPPSAGLSYNSTGMRDTETDPSEGPGPDGNSFVRSLNVNAGETYFIVIDRPEGNSSFNLEWTGTATFSEPPTNEASTNGTALDFERCDDITPFSDGFTEFNLSDNNAPIMGTQTDVTITYHASASDANIGINPLSSPYRNITNPQTIYTRITNNTTECFELTDFQLNVNLGPSFIAPTDFILCDNLDDGNDKNGRVIFDLSSKNSEILVGQNLSDFNVFYYTSRANAESRTGALSNSYYNNTVFNETIFVRIEDATNQNCRSFTELNLRVNEAPNSFNSLLIQCDEDGLADGLTTFNLNEANDELTGGITDRSTKFYTDTTRTNEINGDSFNNTVNPQIIYVEVINDLTGCISNSELTLDVTATDSNNAFLSICDDDGNEDGLHIFDLNTANNTILNGLPSGLDIVYFESFNDAILEQNPLNTVYTNTNPYSQTIYARVENANDCYGISQVFLTVFPLPDIKIDDLFYYCLNDFPVIITIDAAVSGNPNDYTYNWSNGDTTYEIQINTPGVYTVTVTDINNCSKTRTVTVEPSNIAIFGMPPFDVIDASQNNSITVFVTGEGTYQYSLIDENGNTVSDYQDSNIFENIFPGIYTVSVRDIKNDCGVINNDVSVIGFPKFFTPNNDGVNDVWKIYGVSSMFQSNTKVQIFNRFGKLIKQLDPTGEGWNGLLNGRKLPSDDYWFAVTLQDGRVFKNHFTLKN